MGTVVQLPNQATATYRRATEDPSVDRQANHEEAAQRAAEAHLAACQDAMFEADGTDDPANWPESPSIGPFCGCDTCVIREVLHAAWPHVYAAAKEAIARDAQGG